MGEDMEIRSQSMDEENIAWLTLKLIPTLGNRSILRLIERFGSPRAVLEARTEELARVPGLREDARLALHKKETIRSPKEEWDRMQKLRIRLVSIKDPDYPANLGAIPDAPAVLFLIGALEPRDLVSISVVGSRNASPMGLAFTERLCMELTQCGVTIVSGLAVGIDSAAHRGALRGHGRTLAVVGCGLDVEYPRSNTELKKRIMESGAVISEFPLATAPVAGHFPLRNRIISGLALGVVVVEAAERSGSLITARLALEQGREVFAVPGMARHYRSVGPHRLLKQGAKLVESAEDVLEEIRPLIRSAGQPSPAAVGAQPEVSPHEDALLAMVDVCPRHIDDICRLLNWPISEVMSTLMTLELKGMVQQLPGKYFTRFSKV